VTGRFIDLGQATFHPQMPYAFCSKSPTPLNINEQLGAGRAMNEASQ
jgi:hypothetical protein